MRLYFIYIFLSLHFAGLAQVQDSTLVVDQEPIIPLSFDQNQLDDFKENRNFQYELIEREPSIFEKAWDWFVRGLNKVLQWIFGNGPAGSILAFFLKILPYFLLGLLLFFILRFFLKVQTSELVHGSTGRAGAFVSEADAVLNRQDLSALLADAIAKKEYRLAIRYYYLSVLQRLAEKEYIDWHQDKTNEDYRRELTQVDLKEEFNKQTYLYDFVWYGNFNLDEQRFEKASREFKQFLKQL